MVKCQEGFGIQMASPITCTFTLAVLAGRSLTAVDIAAGYSQMKSGKSRQELKVRLHLNELSFTDKRIFAKLHSAASAASAVPMFITRLCMFHNLYNNLSSQD